MNSPALMEMAQSPAVQQMAEQVSSQGSPRGQAVTCALPSLQILLVP